MEYVDPIRDVGKIEEIKKYLKNKSDRDFLFFVLGINTGIRISDLLKLKVVDVWDEGNPKEFLCIYDSRANEPNIHFLNKKVKTALRNYVENQKKLQYEDFLFKSKKHNQPITRQQAYRIINNAINEIGIPGNFGTHTLRKTFGYHAYQKGIAISLLKSIFNHATVAETFRYIGIDQKEKQHIKIDVNL